MQCVTRQSLVTSNNSVSQSASQARVQISKDLRTTQDPVQYGMGHAMYWTTYVGEGFAIYGHGVAVEGHVMALGPLLSGAKSLRNTQSRITLALEVGDANHRRNQFILDARKYVAPLDGYYDVYGHGNPYRIGVFHDQPALDAEQLARLILNSDDYVPGTPVRLVSCWTGASKSGLAQQLADILGVRVMAPNSVVAVGKEYIGGVSILKAKLHAPIVDSIPYTKLDWYEFSPRSIYDR